MNLFTLSDVSKEFGERSLFTNVSFAIGDTVARIVDIFSRKYNVTPTDIMGTSRK